MRKKRKGRSIACSGRLVAAVSDVLCSSESPLDAEGAINLVAVGET